MRRQLLALLLALSALPALAQPSQSANYFFGWTVAKLPAATGSKGQFWPVMDGASASDCSTGGGTTAVLCVSSGTAWVAVSGTGGSGTVTTVSVTTANGVSGTVATATTTPAITLALGAITPTSTNGVSAATMAFMDATSSVQTQLNATLSAATAASTYVPFTGGTLTGPLQINVTTASQLLLRQVGNLNYGFDLYTDLNNAVLDFNTVNGGVEATSFSVDRNTGKVGIGTAGIVASDPIILNPTTGAISSGIDGSIAGSLQLSNAAAAFHSTFGSAATANNTVNFFATVPTNLHTFYCAVSSTTCTLTDTGYAYNAIPNTDITGLGTSSTVNTGTSGATIPLLNGNNTQSGSLTVSGGLINTTTPIRDQTRFVLVSNMTAVATAGVNIGSTGASNVTFSWPVTAANWYDLECKLPVTFAATATIKFQLVSISGSSTISFVNSETMGNTGATAIFQDLYTNAGSSLATSTTPVTGAPGATEQITYSSQFLSSHAGNIGIEFIANGTNNVTMLEGGECGITQTN